MSRTLAKWWPALPLAALLALALTAAPLLASSTGLTTNSWTSALRYAACALGIAAAATPLGLMATVAMCLSILTAEVG